ncbi:MAG: SDR family NAD(P)-dependent oxidoreductase [Pseudomonadota bacterium]
MAISFENKVVVVTGAGRGLGRSHALAYAERGARVVVADLGADLDGGGGGSEVADEVVALITERGGSALGFCCDVSDANSVSDMMAGIVHEMGRIDVLVNNAGNLRDQSFAKMSTEDFEQVCSVHLFGAANCTRAVWPVMRDQGYGRILMTSSGSGIYGNFGQSNYAAGKLGVLGLVKVLKIEGAKYNIHVNAIAPAGATRMNSAGMSKALREYFDPKSVSAAALYLTSDEAPNGVILSAGAHHFSAIDLITAEGMRLMDAKPEDIAAHWDEISDMSNAKQHASLDEAMMSVLPKELLK